MKDYHCPQHFHPHFVLPLHELLYVHSFKLWKSISVFIDYSLVYSNSLLASLNAGGMICSAGHDIQITSDQNISLSSFGKSINAVCTVQSLIYWVLNLLSFFCILEWWTQHWCSWSSSLQCSLSAKGWMKVVAVGVFVSVPSCCLFESRRQMIIISK